MAAMYRSHKGKYNIRDDDNSLIIFFILAKFLKDQRSLAMPSIRYLNFKFLQNKIIHKKRFMDRIVNNIR